MDFLKKTITSLKTSTTIWILLSIILIFIRIYLILELPIFGYIDYINDDELMVEQALNIKQGKWLGPYGYNTLLKGPVFPMYLALISILKIPYIVSVTIIYIMACCLFTYSIKNVIKNKFGLFIIFTFMIFNPIMYSVDFQRVYRNSLTPSLAIILMSFFNIALINRTNKKIYKYLFGIIGASTIFPFFYYIREDSIWMMPFLYFYMIIIGVSILIDVIKTKKIDTINVIKFMLVFLPLMTLTMFELIVGNINYRYYGENTINMNGFESLQEAIYAINIVKNEDLESSATNSREKMRKLYNYSSTLNSMKDQFELLQNIIAGENVDVGDGMFGWVLLETVSSSGYNTFEKQNTIFKNIANEINLAIEEGKLETQELIPIFNDAAAYKFNLRNLFLELINTFKVINNYKTFGIMDTYGSLYSSGYFETRIRYFLEITNDKLLLNNEPNSWISFCELIKDNQQDYINKMQPKVDILNNLRDCYYSISYIITTLGYASYLILTIVFIIKLFKKDAKEFFTSWVIPSGIIGATFTLCFGVAYTSVIKVPVTISFYLMSAYILNTTFCLISIILLLLLLVNVFKEKNKIKVEKTHTNLQ